MRNVLIAIGNSGEPALAEIARARLADASPLVRAMAVWALGQLLEPDELGRLAARHAPGEPDEAVAKEWRRAS